MPEFWFNDGTAPRKAVELYFNDGVAVRTIKEAWFNDGVAVRQVYSGLGTVALTDKSLSAVDVTYGVDSAAAQAYITLASNGEASGTVSGNEQQSGGGSYAPQWLTGSTNGAAYEVEAVLSGNGLTYNSGTGVGNWLSLGTTRTWGYGVSALPVGGSAGSGTVTLTIRLAGGGATQATAVITLYAQASALGGIPP